LAAEFVEGLGGHLPATEFKSFTGITFMLLLCLRKNFGS